MLAKKTKDRLVAMQERQREVAAREIANEAAKQATEPVN